jgi:hypothetical protein
VEISELAKMAEKVKCAIVPQADRRSMADAYGCICDVDLIARLFPVAAKCCLTARAAGVSPFF